MLLIKQLGVGLNIVHFRFKQVLANCLRRHGLPITPEQFVLLDALWDEGPMSQQKLADILSKDKNSVTKLLDGLEKKGMLRRVQSPSDRRVNIVELTDKADGIRKESTKAAVCCVNRLLMGITDEEMKTVVDVFRRIDENIERMERNTDCYGTSFR